MSHSTPMYMRNIVTTSLILLCLCSTSLAQSQQGTVEMDAIAFARDSGKFQVEIYYSIIQGALQFEQRGNTWVAPINVSAEIWQDGHVVAGQDIKKEKIYGTKASVDSSSGSLILDGTALTAKMSSNGKAVLIFHTTNEKGIQVHDTIIRDLAIPIRSADKFFMGGVELANSLVPSTDRANPFEKFGYIITPNPSKVFETSGSKLNYYTELYIPPSSVSPSANCEIITRVLDGQRHVMFSNAHQQVLAATIVPLIGSIDIDGLPTDSYILEVIANRSGNTEASMQKVFFYDSGMKLSEDESETPPTAALDEETLFSSSDISKMTELELQEKGDQAMYVANNDQIKAWKKLKKQMESDNEHEQDITSASPDSLRLNALRQREKDLSMERRFLFRYWRDKDKEQNLSKVLQAYRDYYKYVDEVNKKFTYQKTAGWKTDFGRVYLAYGAPDERNVTSSLHSIGAKPYIAWQYYNKNLRLLSSDRQQSEKTSINYSHPTFIFLDKQGGGKFVLVHSNVQGEIYEPDWYIQEAQRIH